MVTHKWNGWLLPFVAVLILVIAGPGLFAQAKDDSGKGAPDKAAPAKQEPPGLEQKAAAHGGLVLLSKEKEFMGELVMQADGVRLFLYDAKAGPLALKGVTGQARIEFKDLSRQPIDIKMAFNEAIPVKPPEEKAPGGDKKPNGDKALPLEKKGAADDNKPPAAPPKEGDQKMAKQGPPQDSLWAAADLKEIKEGEATVKIHLAALPGSKEKEIDLSAPFKLTTIEKPKGAPAPKPEGEPKRPD